MPELIASLPGAVVDLFDQRLAAAEQAQGPVKSGDWTSRMKADRILRRRQAVADARQDGEAFIALETKRAPERPDTLAVAGRLLASGRHSEALDWVRRRVKPGLKIMTRAHLADGLPPREAADDARTRLEIEILEAMGDQSAAQALRWRTFETTLDAGLLRDHVARLPDFEDEEAQDKAFAHAGASKQPYHALAFFLDWPRLDHAAKLIMARQAEWDGSNYELLAKAAETLQPDQPAAAVVLYRALLDDILSRARSPDTELREQIRDLANERKRFGYRRLFILLRQGGEPSRIGGVDRNVVPAVVWSMPNCRPFTGAWIETCPRWQSPSR